MKEATASGSCVSRRSGLLEIAAPDSRPPVRPPARAFERLSDGGLVVLTGCAHAGIVGTLRHGLALIQ